MTEENLNNSELRERLLQRHFSVGKTCADCGYQWPCDVYQMILVNDELVRVLWGYRKYLAAGVAEMDVYFRPI